jgi:hypothetical protein
MLGAMRSETGHLSISPLIVPFLTLLVHPSAQSTYAFLEPANVLARLRSTEMSPA